MDAPPIRVIVVGDSGVGKTSLAHYICNGEPLSEPSWTTGCNLDIKLVTYCDGGEERSEFVEILDVGGSQSYERSRPIFYSRFDAIILVFDLNNSRSYKNLRKWLKEINSTQLRVLDDNDENRMHLSDIPKIIVGNKRDKVKSQHRKFNPQEDMKIEYIEACSSKGQLDTNRLNSFFVRVIRERDTSSGMTSENYSAYNPQQDINLRNINNTKPLSPGVFSSTANSSLKHRMNWDAL